MKEHSANGGLTFGKSWTGRLSYSSSACVGDLVVSSSSRCMSVMQLVTETVVQVRCATESLCTDMYPLLFTNRQGSWYTYV